jgi:NAD(P)-dependent dehydrogenase (short-subunit alcohol dehydrogenase family)
MLRDNALAGKTIIVTGGGTGLGRAMTTYFCSWAPTSPSPAASWTCWRKTANELREQTGGRVLAIACDVRKYDEVENMLERTIQEFGGVDVLLNNAAGNFISPTERLSHKAFDVIVDIVLRGSYNCTLALGKRWIADKKPGTILNIVTTYASVGSAFVVPSAAAKAGVLAMTRSLAVEWAKYGIRSNAIAPVHSPPKAPGAACSRSPWPASSTRRPACPSSAWDNTRSWPTWPPTSCRTSRLTSTAKS